MSSKNKKSLNTFTTSQFLFFGFNWIVGFGLISAMTAVIDTGAWGFLSFGIAALISWCSMLIYSRAAQNFPDVEGGVYGYAKKAFKNRFLIFFVGWNQAAQIVVISATSPLFLVSLLELFYKSWKGVESVPNNLMIIFYVISVVLFIFITFLGLLKLDTSKFIIFMFWILKWITIAGSIILIIIYGIKDHDFVRNLEGDPKILKGALTTILIANAMQWVFAMNGYNSISAFSKNVEKSNFKKIMISLWFVVFFFYLLTYLFFLGIKNASNIEGFQGIWNKASIELNLSIAGIIIFIIGSIGNKISGQLSAVIFYSRIIGPIAKDGYFPKIFTRKNKNGEYGNAVIFSLILTLISTAISGGLIPLMSGLDSLTALGLSAEGAAMVFMTSYFMCSLIMIILTLKKKTVKAPKWEIAFYFIGLIVIPVVLLIRIFPLIVGEPWTNAHTVILLTYAISMIIGFSIWGFTALKRKIQKRKLEDDLVLD